MAGDLLNLWTLFLSAFISATLLPGGSEAVLAALHQTAQYPISTLLLVATIGNTLGGLTSYAVGRMIIWRYPNKRLSSDSTNNAHLRAINRIKKWGSLVLLFSWVPVIGDPLCVAAGYLKINPLLATTFFAIGKLMRYIFVLWISSNLAPA